MTRRWHGWRYVTLVCCLLGLSFSTPCRAAVSLADLISSSGSVVAGGSLLFDQFSYTGTGMSPPTDRILIDSITDASGNVGIRVHAGFSDATGGGDSLANLGYRVSVLNAAKAIGGATLAGNPAIVGTGTMAISETFTGVPTGLAIYDVSPGSTKLLDSMNLPSPMSSINVALSILGSASNGVATASFVDQTFSQTDAVVPEPGSLAIWFGTLMLLGIVPITQRQVSLWKSLKAATVRRVR